MNLFNTPYYTGHNLDKRLQLDYDINSNDTQLHSVHFQEILLK